MKRSCGHCGREFTAQRSTAKYCSSSCRVKATAKRKRDGAVIAFPTADSATSEAGGELLAVGVAGAVTAELTKAGKMGSSLAQQALVLARRLDSPALDTGSAVASLSKELERLMGVLLAGTEEPDELDEILGEVVQMRTQLRG